MEEHLKENGKIIKWMDMEFLDGLMVDNIKEIMLMIKKKDMGFIIIQMEGVTKGNGKQVSNTVRVFL